MLEDPPWQLQRTGHCNHNILKKETSKYVEPTKLSLAIAASENRAYLESGHIIEPDFLDPTFYNDVAQHQNLFEESTNRLPALRVRRTCQLSLGWIF
jgi:hypothetical protein